MEAVENLIEHGDLTHIPAGEVIIEEGEFEMISYYVLEGKFQIRVTDRETGEKRLAWEVGPGKILGAMAILGGTPRIAEVKCVKNATMLRIERKHLLDFLAAAPTVKARLDNTYKEKALLHVLMKVDFFSHIEGPVMQALAKKVELKFYKKGDVIFYHGDRAEEFFMIRDGFVKVSRAISEADAAFFDSRFDKTQINPMKEQKDEEFIMGYIGPGQYFGELALFDNRRRSATVTALTRLELVVITRNDFQALILRYPEIGQRMREVADYRYASDKQLAQSKQDMLKWVASHDILAAESLLILDLNQCMRCLNCISACAKLHDGVTRITHNGVRYKNILIPTSCRHCREPTCMIGCPTGAIQRDIHGEVFHTDSCIGCGNCASRCPFGNISIVELSSGKKWWARPGRGNGGSPKARIPAKIDKRAVKCDMCMDYDYMGCEHNCPTGAIKSVKPSEYFAKYSQEDK